MDFKFSKNQKAISLENIGGVKKGDTVIVKGIDYEDKILPYLICLYKKGREMIDYTAWVKKNYIIKLENLVKKL